MTPAKHIREIAKHFKDAKRTPKGFRAKCPAHADQRPSLSISLGDRPGTVLMKCWAGCATSDVVSTVGLKMADLFDRHGQAPTKIGAAEAFKDQRRDYQAATLLSQLPATAGDLMRDPIVQHAFACTGTTGARDQAIRRRAADLGVVRKKGPFGGGGWTWCLPEAGTEYPLRTTNVPVTYAPNLSPSTESPGKSAIREDYKPPKVTSEPKVTAPDLVTLSQKPHFSAETVVTLAETEDFFISATVPICVTSSWGPAWADLTPVVSASDLVAIHDLLEVFDGQAVHVRAEPVAPVPVPASGRKPWSRSAGGVL